MSFIILVDPSLVIITIHCHLLCMKHAPILHLLPQHYLALGWGVMNVQFLTPYPTDVIYQIW